MQCTRCRVWCTGCALDAVCSALGVVCGALDVHWMLCAVHCTGYWSFTSSFFFFSNKRLASQR